MRRILLIALASSGIAVAVPAVASAHHHASGSSARHERAHRHGRHHVRFVHFASRSSVTTTTTTTGTGTPPASTPGEAVGTIASFEGGVLKITLNDGTTVSGTVTEDTRIKCPTPTPTAMTSDHGGPGSAGHEDGSGDDQGSGDDEGNGEGGDCHETPQQCGPASLVVGAKVKEAELKLSGAQASWESVELAG